MTSKGELKRRIDDLVLFHQLLGRLLDVSDVVGDGWGDSPRVVPKTASVSEWHAAKAAMDRHAARAARAFAEAGMHLLWKPPGTWNEYPLNPALQWATICDEHPRFGLDVLEACTNQAIGALDARIDDPLKGERAKVGPNAHWFARFGWWIAGTLVGGLLVTFIAFKLGWA